MEVANIQILARQMYEAQGAKAIAAAAQKAATHEQRRETEEAQTWRRIHALEDVACCRQLGLAQWIEGMAMGGASADGRSLVVSHHDLILARPDYAAERAVDKGRSCRGFGSSPSC